MLSLFVLLCMYDICVCIFMYLYMYVSARYQMSSQFLSTLFFETESFLNLELTNSTRLADLQAWGPSASASPVLWLQACAATPMFLCGRLRVSSGPHLAVSPALINVSFNNRKGSQPLTTSTLMVRNHSCNSQKQADFQA